MSTKTFTLREYTLSSAGSIPYIDQRLGAVYKCYDQNKSRHLLHATRIDSSDALLAKFFVAESNFLVIFPYFS